ncbi:bifunctional metallophosphatase/5'-nucleotidase [Halopiger djelfimassiliensis]|uniref:bifunctional metallophosphatase/5'-nucleotidase n=1 Tax=Halopiger djelfimassiliensis TaxID=1293047 RepID=UPI0006782219|nr:bifunctional UDP-sugar hydrolase/5'-nucleotidase [Halopiger djelfimassiliensis]
MARDSGGRDPDHAADDVGRSRRRFLGATVGVSVGALFPATARTVADSDAETVTIVHDTHFHGRLRDAESDALNIARYYTAVRDILDGAANSLFVGNGDDLAPSMLGLEYEGEHMIEALNYMDVDVNGVGNHEYDFGADVATSRFEESEFPWVVANLLDDEGNAVPGTERWITLETGDLTVGVFGLVSGSFHSLTDYPAAWSVLDPVEGAREAVEALRASGADVVVAASHVTTGVHDTLAAEVDGLDAIVGSHSGVVFDEPDVVDGTIVSEFGDEFDHVGSITLDADGSLVDWQRTDLLGPDAEPAPEADAYEEIRTRSVDTIDPDPFLADLTEEWAAQLEAELGKTAFESEVELNATYDNYAVETNWGNLMTDAMRTVGSIGDIDVDIAVQNAGGIRSDSTYGPGEITGADVLNVLPFPNEIVVVELTGEAVVDYLEEAIRSHPAPDFGAQQAVQVSGLSYEWTGHEGETRVENVFVDGEPIDPDGTYTLAHNDYSVGNSAVLSAAEVVLESGQLQGPYVLEQLERKDTVAPERENRILRVDEVVGEASASRDGDEVTLTAAVPNGAETIDTDSFRAVIRTGDELAAKSARVDGDTVAVTFDAADLTALAETVDSPVMRLFGRYDPAQDAWPYDFEVPTSSGYDRFVLRADVSASAVLGDDSDGNGTGDGGSDDGTDTDGDGVPGFGPLAALAGGGAGTYAYARGRADDESSATTDRSGPDRP